MSLELALCAVAASSAACSSIQDQSIFLQGHAEVKLSLCKLLVQALQTWGLRSITCLEEISQVRSSCKAGHAAPQAISCLQHMMSLAARLATIVLQAQMTPEGIVTSNACRDKL